MDSKSFRSLDGHLDKREKLLVKIGWSQLNACCLILLWEGLERGLFVRKDIPLCSQILLMIIFHLDLSYLRKYFSGNLYPQYLFDLSVRKYLDKMFNPQLPVQSVQKLPVSITLPYLGPLSIKLSKDLNNIIKKFYPQIQFRCLFNNKRTISSFFPFKDQIPLMVSSNIIYKYSCGQCQSI